MDLAVMVPWLSHLANRIFECRVCRHAELMPE
jgi:hypothetical protein